MATDQAAYKNKLKQFAVKFLEERIAATRQNISNAREAANSEGKSSAGDKYETARAMGHLEQEMHGTQLAKYVNELAFLHSIDADTLYHAVTNGALAQCANCSFFISVGLGKQFVEEKIIYFLSLQAPLAKLLQGKKAGEAFNFNGTPMKIVEVF